MIDEKYEYETFDVPVKDNRIVLPLPKTLTDEGWEHQIEEHHLSEIRTERASAPLQLRRLLPLPSLAACRLRPPTE
jgi:hypothetical protein